MDNTTTMDHAEFTARRSLPMMALRGLTVFPGMMLTFEVERSMSIAALIRSSTWSRRKTLRPTFPPRTMCTAWARSAASSR